MATAAPEVRLSRVGKRPVNIPKGVTVNVSDVKLDVQGPKGKMSVPIPGQVTAKKDGDAISFTSSAPGRDGARASGSARSALLPRVRACPPILQKPLARITGEGGAQPEGLGG